MKKSIVLKDGKRVNVIALKLEDTDRLHDLLQNLSEEDHKWSMAPYKREWVQRWLNTPHLIQLAAEYTGELFGFVCVEEWTHPRLKGTGHLGAYVHRDYQDTDLLSTMIGFLLEKVKKKGLHKVNTEGVANNNALRIVLEEHGFYVEGRKRQCFYGVDGRYYDTLILGKIMNN